MDLDLALQNVVKRSPMDSAMHGVASNLGDGHYRLNSFYEAEDEFNTLMGDSLMAYVPNPVSAYVRPPTGPPNTPNPASFSQTLGSGYSISYDQSSQAWALNRMTVKGGLSGFWSRLTGSDDTEATPLVSKAGANSMHRFLTTIQEMNLPMELKTQITEICVNKTDNTGISEFVGGQVITSAIDNPLQSDLFLYQEGNPIDILASEYVSPPILTTSHAEQFVAPPTHSPGKSINFVGGNQRPF